MASFALPTCRTEVKRKRVRLCVEFRPAGRPQNGSRSGNSLSDRMIAENQARDEAFAKSSTKVSFAFTRIGILRKVSQRIATKEQYHLWHYD